MTDTTRVLMLAENFGGIIAPHSHEMYTAGKQVAADLGVPLVFGLLGTGHEDALSNIGTLPDSVEIRTRDLEEDEEYPYEAWADAAAEMIREVKPHIVIGSGSSFGLDYVPRAAARLGMPLATWVTSVAVDDGGLVVTRDVLGGRAETAIRCEPGTPFMFALEPGMVDPSRIGDVEPITLQEVFAELAPDSGAATRANVRKLTASERIVCGGRGMRGPEGIALVEELADVLEAAVGASGAAVLQGMLPHEYQVGSSGEVVRPKLYLAVGLSGTPQHTFGMRESQFIVAINSDPNAPIFQLADFGIVGDLFTVVPALIAALKNPA